MRQQPPERVTHVSCLEIEHPHAVIPRREADHRPDPAERTGSVSSSRAMPVAVSVRRRRARVDDQDLQLRSYEEICKRREGATYMQYTVDQYERLALVELEKAANVDRSDVPNALHVQRALVYATLALVSVQDQHERDTPSGM
jgi:hypothetical protein